MRIKTRVVGDGTVVTLDGDVDSDISRVLAGIEASVSTPKLIFDCGEIKKINSVGIRDWIPGIDRLKAKFTVSFAYCSQVFVDLALMIPAFISGLPILSFYTLRVCDSCGLQHLHLIECINGQVTLPTSKVCGKCGGELFGDEDLESDIEFVLASVAPKSG